MKWPLRWVARPTSTEEHVTDGTTAIASTVDWEETIWLWESLRDEALGSRDREEIDAVFSRQVP